MAVRNTGNQTDPDTEHHIREIVCLHECKSCLQQLENKRRYSRGIVCSAMISAVTFLTLVTA